MTLRHATAYHSPKRIVIILSDFIFPTVKRITSRYGYRTHPITGERTSKHQGVDFAEPGYHEIKATASGTVTRSYRSTSYGECVFILHNINGQQFESVYAHMRAGSRRVNVGQKVKQGQVIGIMGSTGNSTGQHLHFELHKGRWNFNKSNSVDPLNYLPSLKDEDVEELQKNLKKLGYDVGKIDGMIGEQTKKAIEKFQQDEGLEVDGIAGAKLNHILNGGLSMSDKEELKKLIEKQEKEIASLKKQLNKKLNKPSKVNKPSETHQAGWNYITKSGISNGQNPHGYLTREQFATLIKKYHDKETVLPNWMQNEIANNLQQAAPHLNKPDKWLKMLKGHNATAAILLGAYILGNLEDRKG